MVTSQGLLWIMHYGESLGGRKCCDCSKLLGSEGYSATVEASSPEEENRYAENENAERLVAEYIQKNADDYHGAFNQAHDGDRLIAVANHGANGSDRTSRGLIVKAVQDSMRGGGDDVQTTAANELNMSKLGTVMTGAEILAVAYHKNRLPW